MRPDLDEGQAALVRAVDRTVAEASPGTTPLEHLRRLGQEQLLAVHYPPEYGGSGLALAYHAAVGERLGELGLPDVAHLITVQGVGCTILNYGTPQQRGRWLPEFASGRLLASLLLSEFDAGSDLAGIRTTAVPHGDGWRINGTKAWSLYTDWSGLALCSVRTKASDNRYDGISLLLLDPHASGVEITPLHRAAGQPYFTVSLRDVVVGPDALLGELHRGWQVLPTAIGYERSGFDYLTRASMWLAAAEREARRLPRSDMTAAGAQVVRLKLRVENARTFAYHAVATADGLDMDEVAAAYAKLACGRAAQAVARWAGLRILDSVAAESGRPDIALLHAALAEAPEFTISGGAQELQLDQIAQEYPIGSAVR